MANTLNLGSGNWGAKDSLLLGYYEDGGKFFPETFDVTRATGGTRVNKNGLIETPAEIGSEAILNGDFSDGLNNWNSEQGIWTVSNGVANGNGATGSSQELQQNISPSGILVGDTVKISFEIKNYVGGSVQVIGVTPSSSKSANGVYEYVGNVTSVSIRFRGSAFNGSVTNVSLKKYNDNNLARVDYLDDAKGVLLTEPQSTNLVTYSEDFSNSSWTKTNSSITSNSVISPDGTLNADKLVENTTIGEKFTQKIISVSNTTIYTSTVFVKFAGREWIRFTDAQSSNRIHFNTKTGVFGVISGTVIDYNSIALSNGWYKLSLTTTSVATAYAIRIVLAENDNDVSYTGNGTDGVYIWGAQLEQLSHSTSYIKTEGSTVTRNADLVTNGGDVNSFNSEEGVLYAEIAALANDLTSRKISLNNGSFSNQVSIRYDTTSNQIKAIIYDGTNVLSDLTFVSSDITQLTKVGYKYKSNECSLWVNGTEVASSGGSLSGLSLSKLSFDSGTSENFYGKTKNVQVFNEALSDSDLLSLTTTGSVPYWTQYSAMATTLNYTNK